MKFDNFYGGHVEMENLGFQGLPADEHSVQNGILTTAAAVAIILIEDGGDGGKKAAARVTDGAEVLHIFNVRKVRIGALGVGREAIARE